MKHYCNPINIPYRYQLYRGHTEKSVHIYREAADPTLIWYKGHLLLFASMSAGFYDTVNLADWTFYPLPESIPLMGYAPDVREVDGWLYFTASGTEIGNFYRTKDPWHGEFEELKGKFPFWDPDLFQDDDGRIYFYWGCGRMQPIKGLELDSVDLSPICEERELINPLPALRGYERGGENHKVGESQTYIEGAFMTKRDNWYYLQYAVPGTQYNIYGDSVFIGESPLGPFFPAENNPFSYKPFGYITGAGHGSTVADEAGHYMHASTMRISVNHIFERRVGVFPVGFDKNGQMICDQRFADWPIRCNAELFEDPDYFLLSYRKEVNVSNGANASSITDEDIRTFWRADEEQAEVIIDLDRVLKVSAIQINFADSHQLEQFPEAVKVVENPFENRGFDLNAGFTRWILEGSADFENWVILKDKSIADSDLPHDFIEWEKPWDLRYIRLHIIEMPYHQNACLSGIRIFGVGNGQIPDEAYVTEAVRTGKMDAVISWHAENSIGACVQFGSSEDTLYHSASVTGIERVELGALTEGQPLYVRIDPWNENGLRKGKAFRIY